MAETAKKISMIPAKAVSYTHLQMVVLCMCIIFVIIITNYIIFLMIEKYTTVEEKQHIAALFAGRQQHCQGEQRCDHKQNTFHSIAPFQVFLL